MAELRVKTGSTPGHPTDIRIGVCRGIGLSRDDTARVCGVSVPTVDLRKDEPITIAWETWASDLMTAPSMNAAKHMEDQARKRIPKVLHAWDRGLEDENVETAMRAGDRVADRALGKATQRVETTADITERHVLEIPEETLNRIREFAAALQPRRIAGEVSEIIDVQQVEEGA